MINITGNSYFCLFISNAISVRAISVLAIASNTQSFCKVLLQKVF